jgi:dTDP-4-amino-4,6-dideoxygalactose transaminase
MGKFNKFKVNNNLDVVEKIDAFSVVKVFLTRGTRKPFSLLSREFGLKGDWQENYFNWGRNALFYFFKKLEFNTIAFPSFTCPTLVEAAKKAGKKVSLIEVDLNTFNLDIGKIPVDTKCLVAVHTFGNPLDIAGIRKKAKDVFIIEDMAHSLYSEFKGKFIGGQGDAVLFSLYKQIANINGSLLLSKDKILTFQKKESQFKYLKRLVFKLKGLHQPILSLKRQNYLPSIKPEPVSGLMPSSLVFNLFNLGFKKLSKEVESRRKLAKLYFKLAGKSPYFKAQEVSKNSKSSFYHFAVRLNPELCYLRDKVVLHLRGKNIYPARLWPNAPVALREYKNYAKICPNALNLAKTVINLPINSKISKKEAKYLFDRLNKTIKALKK